MRIPHLRQLNWSPPCKEIFRRSPAKNPTQRPSGEKNGLNAPSVPARGLTSDELTARAQLRLRANVGGIHQLGSIRRDGEG